MTQNRNLSIHADYVSTAGVLNPAGGGTGITTTPANGQIPIGNGTNYTAATITAGTGITVTNGAGSISIAASGGGQVYSAAYDTSTTWVAPTGVTRVRVWCIGGGGGGGSNTSCLASPQSGGAGGVAIGVYTVTPGTTYTVTVGAGGAGQTTNGNGSSGGTSSFGPAGSPVISATGGAGGSSNSITNTAQGAGSSETIYNSASSITLISSTNIPHAGSPIGSPYILPLNYTGANTPRTWTTGYYSPGWGGSAGGGGVSGSGIAGIIYLDWNQ